MTFRKNDRPALGRRSFIRGAGAGAGALVVGAAGLLPSDTEAAGAKAGVCKNPACDYDVIVIGGGFAGVSAARDCRENGFKTLLLEARNRLGGRTFSAEFAGYQVELGGAWIHWSQPFVWSEKERYNLEIEEMPSAVPERMLMHEHGRTRLVSMEEMQSVVEGFQAYTAEARSILERPFDHSHTWDRILEADNLSARDRLNQLELSPLQRTFMESSISAAVHNYTDVASYVEALRQFSSAAFNDVLTYMDSVSRYKFKDGTISLINAMLEDGRPEVRLSTPVTQVEDLGGKVRVTTQMGDQLSAASVIVALPMNVLPSLKFDPPLHPKVVEAGNEQHAGQGVKLYALAKGQLGKILCFSGESHPLPTVLTYEEDQDHTLLCGFGPDREKIDFYDEEAVQSALQDYIPDVEIESVFTYDWVLDPYSRGTYSNYRTGWMSKYYKYFGRDSGRIIDAQSDHGTGYWRGFIDGAIGAGVKAAERVNRQLG